jgi:hypothetical protein
MRSNPRLIVLLEAEAECVALLELGYFLKTLPFDKFTDGSAVGKLHEIGLEIVIGEAEVEELLRVVLHLLQLQINHSSKVLSDILSSQVNSSSIGVEILIVLKLVVLFLLEEADRELFALFCCHS